MTTLTKLEGKQWRWKSLVQNSAFIAIIFINDQNFNHFKMLKIAKTDKGNAFKNDKLSDGVKFAYLIKV